MCLQISDYIVIVGWSVDVIWSLDTGDVTINSSVTIAQLVRVQHVGLGQVQGD